MPIVKVQVTAEDIAQGECGQECFCPVAMALGRALGLSRSQVLVNRFAGKWWAHVPLSPGKLVRSVSLALPEIAGRFASDFDDFGVYGGDEREPPRSFDFELEVPDELLED
jgi:hypothetical protein